MVKAKLSGNDIYNIAESFRKAIIEAKYNREFSSRDRMSNFPGGCCDDSYDLLAYYLHERYNIHTEQVNGVYRDNNPYNTTNHAWLLMKLLEINSNTVQVFRKKCMLEKKYNFIIGLKKKRFIKTMILSKMNDYGMIIKLY